MKTPIYKNYDELPLFLKAELVAKVLGVLPSNGYELMNGPGFPVLKIGSRMVVPRRNLWSGWHSIRQEVATVERMAETRYSRKLFSPAS